MKTFFVAFLSFVVISGVLLFVGYFFQVNQLMFRFYNETATGFEAGGSVIPFIVAIICSYFVGSSYERIMQNKVG
ncbi:hypothetical protein RYX56_00795 [Alkalihalophilus lindianensis]|uniref:Uncharacterized protein n=1 Tax=Alkalihalophilus lindianensis TaxID=1630542 RepID=A0ABU3X4U8_9BACI|nr:hypothetical protein [Alkalihalophilus lindianensis]MDV2682902.1 hypothetical protein [Alkalihalophilus lindianensis]